MFVQVRQVFALAPVTTQNKTALQQAVDALSTGSATNLSGGLFKGVMEQLQAPALASNEGSTDWEMVESEQDKAQSNAVKAVFLFTDGQANRGVTDSVQIVEMMNNIMAQGMTADAPAALKVSPAGSPLANMHVWVHNNFYWAQVDKQKHLVMRVQSL